MGRFDFAGNVTVAFGGDREAAARFFGVHHTTLRRWLKGKSRPPETAVRLLELRVGGWLTEPN